ncbi:MAG: 50S ribosomal protein L25 [Bacteroidetes bacterium]|nr:MAG: 50S ribosomal protein L25 [Bacteroidota bacterium]
MEIIAINGQPKSHSGSSAAKKLRQQGLVPAVLYKSGGGEAIQFSLQPADFRHLVYTAKFKLVEINIDGSKHKCILKDIQFHPVTEEVVHLDFLELVPGVPFKAAVPLRFVGQAPGVKSGGKFIPSMRKVNILTTPENIVDEIMADVSKMRLGDVIRVRDLQVPDGVTVTNNTAVPIASIEIPRSVKTDGGAGEEEGEEAAEGAEGGGDQAGGEATAGE